MTTDDRRLPAELTLVEAARFLGIDRSNAYRKFRSHLKWGMHSKRRVRVVPTTMVICAIAQERNEGPALPEIDRQSERISAIMATQERQAIWIAKVAKRLGVPV